MKWRKTKINFFDSDECEIANAVYAPEGLQGKTKTLRVVCIRAPKEDGYKYYAILTNIFSHEWKAKQVIKFYRGRATDWMRGFHHLPIPDKLRML